MSFLYWLESATKEKHTIDMSLLLEPKSIPEKKMTWALHLYTEHNVSGIRRDISFLHTYHGAPGRSKKITRALLMNHEAWRSRNKHGPCIHITEDITVRKLKKNPKLHEVVRVSLEFRISNKDTIWILSREKKQNEQNPNASYCCEAICHTTAHGTTGPGSPQ